MTTSSRSRPHVGGEGSTGRRGAGRGRRWSTGGAAVAGALLVALVGAGPAAANPASSEASGGGRSVTAAAPVAPVALKLHLDGRTAGRMLADAKEPDPVVAGTDEDKAKTAEKSDEVKMTVTKGPAGAPPKAAPGSDGTFAFMKDWPFWAAVGGVVIVGAAVFMINRNGNQDHSCSATYNAGCFGAK